MPVASLAPGELDEDCIGNFFWSRAMRILQRKFLNIFHRKFLNPLLNVSIFNY